MKHSSIFMLMYALSAVGCATNKSAETPPQPENPNPGTADAFDPSLQAPTNNNGAVQSASAKGSAPEGTWNTTTTTGVDTTAPATTPSTVDSTTVGTGSTTTSSTTPTGVRGSTNLEGTSPGTSRDTVNSRGSTWNSSTSSDSRNSSASDSRSTSSGSANKDSTSGSANKDSKDANPKDTKDVNADNSKKNKRDRADGPVTPPDQGGSEADRKITQQIRQAVVGDKSLSFNAKNVKIITIDGKVTLRGTVNSDQERSTIEAAAKKVAGVAQVDNQLEVKNK